VKRFRRIVHATDFSPASRRAFDAAVTLAKDSGASLVIVHVMDTAAPVLEDAPLNRELYDRMVGAARGEAERRLDALVGKARRAGARARGRIVDGSPRDRIVRVARAEGADVLVVGTHGRTGLGRLLLGSVAAHVATTASCPVLTVRGRAAAR
jgi:nucleotide-binding universal stress UspA family protein